MKIFENIHIDWLGKRKLFYMLSTSLFLIGMLSIIFRGLGFGIDFKGGTEIVLQFQKPINISDMRSEVEKLNLGTIEVKTFGGETGALVRTELQEIPKQVYPKVLTSIEKEIDNTLPGVERKIIDST